MIVYVSDNPNSNSRFPVEVPTVDLARSLLRGLLTSPEAFVFEGCGFVCIRGGFGARPNWFRVDDSGGWCPLA